MYSIKRTLATALVALLLPMAASAVTFHVNLQQDLPDDNIGDGICSTNPLLDPDEFAVCSLRAAVMQGNAVPANEPVTIMLQAGKTYDITIPGDSDDLGITGDLDLLRQMTIRVPENFEDHAVVRANFVDRAFDIFAPSVLYGLEIVNGFRADRDGAAIKSRVPGTSLQQIHVHNNSVGDEGNSLPCAITGGVVLMDSRVSFNGALPHGIHGVCNDSMPLTVLSSTIHENSGNGIFMQTTATLTLHGSTISGNLADGVALRDASGTIRNSTITNNGANQLEFTTAAPGQFKLTLIGSIVAGSDALPDCNVGNVTNDSTFTTSWNAYSDASCFSDVFFDNSLHNVEFDLGELQDNGGPTPTYRPAPSSDVVDRAPASICNNFPLDQRGLPRPVSYDNQPMPRCDIGAVELQQGEQDVEMFSDGFE